MPRKIIVQIATSADGYIARPDGDFMWLDRPPVRGNYGMAAFEDSVDAVIMGRKTYEIALHNGQPSYPGLKNYVFSNQPPVKEAIEAGVEYVNGDVAEFAKRVRRTKGLDLWLMGGSELIAGFLDAQAIDEFLIHVIPLFIGEGIPLVQARHRNVPLELLSTKKFVDGVVRLHYKVGKVRKASRRS